MTPDISLQEMFIRSRGRPIDIDGRTIVQEDKIDLAGVVEATIEFVGDVVFRDNAAVIAIPKPGKILLSDGTAANAVQIWDEVGLPRVATHIIESAGLPLRIHNKYRIHHSREFITEDNFTGDAGMIVTRISSCKRRYECSNGPDSFPLPISFST